jgi:hypothetical protein
MACRTTSFLVSDPTGQCLGGYEYEQLRMVLEGSNSLKHIRKFKVGTSGVDFHGLHHTHQSQGGCVMSLESISQALAELELKKKRLEAEIAAVQHEMGLWRLLRAIWFGEGH